jgi:act minimal PKS acyl carrier protein
MTCNRLTINQLRTILVQSAGEAEGYDLDGDIEDIEFEDLGYDSICLLEAAGRIERDCGVKLDDDLIVSARTPRALLAVVNEQLAIAS